MKRMIEKKFYIKIVSGKYRSLAETVYYRNELPFDVVNKWMWYFQYREALFRIANPRHYVELLHGSYDYVPSNIELQKRLRDRIVNKKGKITSFENKLKKAENSWTSLFPIQDDEIYKKCVSKINSLKKELLLMEYEYA